MAITTGLTGVVDVAVTTDLTGIAHTPGSTGLYNFMYDLKVPKETGKRLVLQV